MAQKTVLVIEDNELNMKLVCCLLDFGKYRALQAVDAETGLEVARKHLPDLILMDIQLPGMDGLSATKIITSSPTMREIPVIALSSYAMSGDEEKAREAGCIAYITKPIDTRNFLTTIADYLA